MQLSQESLHCAPLHTETMSLTPSLLSHCVSLLICSGLSSFTESPLPCNPFSGHFICTTVKSPVEMAQEKVHQCTQLITILIYVGCILNGNWCLDFHLPSIMFSRKKNIILNYHNQFQSCIVLTLNTGFY